MTFNNVRALAFVLFLGGLSVAAIGAEPVAGATRAGVSRPDSSAGGKYLEAVISGLGAGSINGLAFGARKRSASDEVLIWLAANRRYSNR